MVLKTFTMLCLMVAGSYSLPKSQVWRDLHGIHFDLFPGSGASDHVNGEHRWKRQTVREDSNPDAIVSADGVVRREDGGGNTDGPSATGDSPSGESPASDLIMPQVDVNGSDKGSGEGGNTNDDSSGKGEVAETRTNEAIDKNRDEGNGVLSTTDCNCEELKKMICNIKNLLVNITSNYDCNYVTSDGNDATQSGDPSTSGTDVSVNEPTTTEEPTHDKPSEGETNQSGTPESETNNGGDSDSVVTTGDPTNKPSGDDDSGPKGSQPNGEATTQGGGHEETSGGQAQPTETDSAGEKGKDTSPSSNNKSTDDETCDVNESSQNTKKMLIQISDMVYNMSCQNNSASTPPCCVNINIYGNRQCGTK